MRRPPLMQYGKNRAALAGAKARRPLKTTSDMGSPLQKHVSRSDLWFLCGAAEADCSDVELIHHCQQTLSRTLPYTPEHTYKSHKTNTSLHFEFPLSFLGSHHQYEVMVAGFVMQMCFSRV